MSQVTRPEKEAMESIQDALEGVAKFLIWVGGIVFLASASLLVFYIVSFSGTTRGDPAQALQFVEFARKALTGGAVALFVGSAYLYWGADWLGGVQVAVAGGLYFAPLYGPAVLNARNPSEVLGASYAALQGAGMPAGIIGLCVLVADIVIRVQSRFHQGIKVDQLKYGKGIKEEKDRKNVFLGKCWQLPYCRKFVRERCPIYHARRTCWREKVGCMCEEEVIKGAMENRTIPKDAIAAARYIPQNNKITFMQKLERCRHCVIYNEHQKHKYRAALPIVLISFVGFYALGRNQLMENTKGVFQNISEIVGQATLRQSSNIKVPVAFQEFLLICVVFVLMAYSLKLLEFLIFKLKI